MIGMRPFEGWPRPKFNVLSICLSQAGIFSNSAKRRRPYQLLWLVTTIVGIPQCSRGHQDGPRHPCPAQRAMGRSRTLATAQHRQMLDQVLDLFEIRPGFDLDLMKPGQDLTDITSNVLVGMRGVLREWRPDAVWSTATRPRPWPPRWRRSTGKSPSATSRRGCAPATFTRPGRRRRTAGSPARSRPALRPHRDGAAEPAGARTSPGRDPRHRQHRHRRPAPLPGEARPPAAWPRGSPPTSQPSFPSLSRVLPDNVDHGSPPYPDYRPPPGELRRGVASVSAGRCCGSPSATTWRGLPGPPQPQRPEPVRRILGDRPNVAPDRAAGLPALRPA